MELRCLDDDFAIAMVKCGGRPLYNNTCSDDHTVIVSVDSHPQWRKMAWNEESTCLAVVNRCCLSVCVCVCLYMCAYVCVLVDDACILIISSGEVSVISSNGQRLCHIDNKVCLTWHHHHGYYIKCR